MDWITIKELEVYAKVGVPAEERAHPQRLLLDVRMGFDIQPAVVKDDLELTIDYYQVAQRLIGHCKQGEWKLIETLAEQLANLILKEFRTSNVQVEVKKFILPETRWVSVRIERGQIALRNSNTD